MASQLFYSLCLFLGLLTSTVYTAKLDYSGEALTTRFWDCCKPSCAWAGKADVNQPVVSCGADDKPTGANAGSVCGTGGTAYSCTNQQPWAVNDTVAYGYAGVYILPNLTANGIEGAWCCACYQLDFTSDPLKGKSLIVQASNTAYDVTTTNRFSLAVPGGNTTTQSACAQQFGVSQSVFGSTNNGVSKKEDCNNLPQQLQGGCNWRFDWFKDASYPTANFKRVVCPAELTSKSQCIRNDDKQLAAGATSAASSLTPSSFLGFAITAVLLSIF